MVQWPDWTPVTRFSHWVREVREGVQLLQVQLERRPPQRWQCQWPQHGGLYQAAR